jgi:hypothetical protein
MAGSLGAAEYLHQVDFMLLVVATWLWPAHRWSEQMMDATVQLTRRISGEVMRRKANSLHWIEQMLRHHDVRSKRVLNLVKSRADSLGSPAQHWPTCGGEKSIPGKGAEAVVELEGAVRAADRL